VPIRRVLVWFRHALRIHDNPCLTAALEEQLAAAAAVDGQHVEVQVFPLFIFDGLSGSTQLCGFNRFQFLLECLKDLDQQFSSASRHGKLHLFRARDASHVFNELHNHFPGGIHHILFHQEAEPVWGDRDERVRGWCESQGVR